MDDDLANVRAIPYSQPMRKSERLEVRLDCDLRARLDAEAARQGRKLTEVVRRACESMLSEATGTIMSEQAGPVPVPSANPEKRTAAEGVRPAASTRTSSEPAASKAAPSTKTGVRKSAVSPDPVLAVPPSMQPEAGLEATLSGQGSGHTPTVLDPSGSRSAKETAPTKFSASPRTQPTMRRDVGPKPASASKPRLKAAKPKKTQPRKETKQ